MKLSICNKITQPRKSLVVLLLALVAIVPSGNSGETPKTEAPFIYDFGKFEEQDWLKSRDSLLPASGAFDQKAGCVISHMPEGLSKADGRNYEKGITYCMRLLKDVEMQDGKIEVELSLVGPYGGAPSIYFRTQTEGEIHKEAYNLVIFDFEDIRPDYHGLNLWKWKEKWPGKAGKCGHWQLIASWSFDVPFDKKIKLGVDFKESEIKVFVDDRLKGSVFDPEPLGSGKVGICSCEGPNLFYTFKATKSK
jgi:hypothetical protein